MMKNLEEAVQQNMFEYGALGQKWRIKVVGMNQQSYSDWADIEVDAYKPRCRKPSVHWTLKIYKPKDQIYWDKSKFVYL